MSVVGGDNSFGKDMLGIEIEKIVSITDTLRNLKRGIVRVSLSAPEHWLMIIVRDILAF